MNNSCATRRITSIAIFYNGNDKGNAEMVAINNLLGSTPEEQFEEMKIIANRNERVQKFALTGYISPPKEVANKITDDELRDLCLLTLKNIGVTKNNQYRLDIHNSTKIKHLHFIVNRIDTFGNCTIPARNVGKRFGEELRKICLQKGLLTDKESSKQKKNKMLDILANEIINSKNFIQLKENLNDKGYLLETYQNSKDGISGLRLANKSDINNDTEKIYKSGFKLSEISNKLNIREIKEIFQIKKMFAEILTNKSNLKEIKDNLQKIGFELFFKFNNNDKKIENIWIKPKEGLMTKNGYFFNSKMGYNLSEIDKNLNSSIIESISQNNFSNTIGIDNEQKSEILMELSDDLIKFLEPNFVSSEEEHRKKKKSIYDNNNPYFSY